MLARGLNEENPMRVRFPASLLWRVYGFAALILTASSAVFIAVLSQVVFPATEQARLRAGAFAVSLAAEAPPQERAAVLEKIRRELELDVSLHDASSAASIEVQRFASERSFFLDDRVTLAVALPAQGEHVGYGLATPLRPRSLSFGFGELALALLALLALAWPMARSIAAPLGALRAAIARFGAGDLRARMGTQRRDEIGELARSFDAMADRIAALLAAERLLLAGISHELRTPLQRVRLAVELAEEAEAQGAAQRASWCATLADLSELENLISDVIAVARLEARSDVAGQALVAREPLESAALITAAAERFRALHPERALRIDVPPALPRAVGDRRLLVRALANLLSNAHKYSPPEAPIALRARGVAQRVEIEVIDRGVGIADQALPQLLEPFRRAPGNRSEGLGLGLAFARRIIEANGGELRIVSAEGEGTRATVVLIAET
jgi:signal transduction histidine kinase